VTPPRVDVDFSDPGLIADPFPVYEEVREAGRVVWNGAAHVWMVPGYDDCVEILSDTKGARFGVIGARYPELTFWFDAPNMIIADPPDHRRLRQGLAKSFTPAAIERNWAPRVRAVVEELLVPLAEGRDDVDLISDFTKIPVVIVAEMLGVPEERHEDFRRWSNAVVSNLRWGREDPEGRRLMDEAVAELNAYLTEEIERHRRDQPDDLLTVIVNMPGWSEAEMRSGAVNLLLAGYDTTAKLMGVCLDVLERHPDQRRLLVEKSALVPNAIEEILRWEGVTQLMPRVVKKDIVFGGTPLTRDDVVFVLLAAGNRDPARWSEPWRFDVRRPYQQNLGFGLGPHICIGAPLARVETRIALETLLRLAPEYRLRGIDYGDAFFARGPESGLIEIGATTAA